MSFENQIQEWVSIDNQIKIYNEKLKELREKRNALTSNITQYVDTHNLPNLNVQISDGRLKLVQTKVVEPLTFTYLEKSLGKIFTDEQKVKQIINYVKQNRTSRIVPEIKRISNN
jgi:hypothetical protein